MFTTNNSQADNFLREVKEETAKNSYASNDIVVVTSYVNEKPETITLKAQGFFDGDFDILDCMPVDGQCKAAITVWPDKMHIEVEIMGNIVRKDFHLTKKPEINDLEYAFLKENVLRGNEYLNY